MKHHLANLNHHIRRVLRNTSPSTIAATRQKRTAFQHFAEQNGFVYFGFVDHTGDEHGVIRGLTATSRQADNHYLVGSQNGYDIAFVERQVALGEKKDQLHDWIVLDIALHGTYDFPHIFIGTGHHSEHFYAQLFLKFRSLRRVPLGTFEHHNASFTDHYSIFSVPSAFIETEQLLPSHLTQIIGSHFRPLAIEIAHGHLYIYADNQKVTNALLQTMLQNGLWLAEQLDKA